LINGSESFDPAYINVKFSPANENAFGVVFNFQDWNNGYTAEILNDCFNNIPLPDPISAENCTGNSGYYGIRLRKNGVVVAEYENPEIYLPNNWYDLKISKNYSGDIEIFWNNEKVILYRDENPLNQGKIGIYSNGSKNLAINGFSINNFKQKDVIGARIYENPDFLSPLDWYKQTVTNPGQPSNVSIDGYYGLKDGRTTYVGAADLKADLKKENGVYSYNYLISYSDKAEQETIKVFNELLSNWDFNTNISLNDKNRLRNDLLRIYDINEIKNILTNYYNKNEIYPVLGAGTYVKGKTNSLWSSWQKQEKVFQLTQ